MEEGSPNNSAIISKTSLTEQPAFSVQNYLSCGIFQVDLVYELGVYVQLIV